MIYTKEVENMCPVAKGAKHEPAPIPEEGKWVHSKKIEDISGFTHGVYRIFRQKKLVFGHFLLHNAGQKERFYILPERMYFAFVVKRNPKFPYLRS